MDSSNGRLVVGQCDVESALCQKNMEDLQVQSYSLVLKENMVNLVLCNIQLHQLVMKLKVTGLHKDSLQCHGGEREGNSIFFFFLLYQQNSEI